MTLRTWWLQQRLARIDRRLRHLRGFQKRAREHVETLQEERKRGALTPEQYKAKEAKLNAERERLTHEINALIVRAEHLNVELRQ